VIIQGDALEVLRGMASESVDAIVTDPPYAITGDSAIAASRTIRQTAETQFYRAWLVEHCDEWIRVTKPDGLWWIALDWRGLLTLDDVIARRGIRRAPVVGVWNKKRIGMGGILRRSYETFAVVQMNDFRPKPTGEPDVWDVPWGGGSTGVTDHPAEKPVELMERAVRTAMQGKSGGVVLDPFCGSASTGVAALRLGYTFIGVERDEAFAEAARLRLSGGPLFAESAS